MDFDFNPESTAPCWQRHLDRSLPHPDKQTYLAECLALPFYKGKIEKAPILHGRLDGGQVHRRCFIVYFTELESPFLNGEVDESYFGGVRKGIRGRGAAGKVPISGCLKRKGKVYTQMISDVKEKTLMPIIRCKIRQTGQYYLF